MLRVFVEVARAGSLVAAAERLGRVPSALSTSLKQLEEHLGAPLFESERKSHLTPLGSFTLEVASREVAQLERSIASLTSFATGQTGEVRLAAVPSFATAVLPALVKAFLAARPGVRLEIYDMDSAAIRSALREERIDAGVLSDGTPDAEIDLFGLACDPFGIVMPKDHPLATKETLGFSDLVETDFIVNPLCRYLPEDAKQAIERSTRLHIQNTTALLAMVRAGLGVTLLPRLVASQSASAIVFRPLAENLPVRQLDLLIRAGARSSPATAAFAAFLRDKTLAMSGGLLDPPKAVES